MADFTRDVQGRLFHKASASGALGNCVFLPKQGPLNAVHDSKSGVTLDLPANQLVAFARKR